MRETRAPVPLPPPKSCDCQFHIYGDPAKYPPKKDAYYQPPDATFEHMQGVLKTLGFERGVIVHPMPYDTDHRLLIDTLEGLGGSGRKNFRATCIIKDNVSDQEMEKLNGLGVCAGALQHRQALRAGLHPRRWSAGRSTARARSAGTRGCMSAATTSRTSATSSNSIKDITVRRRPHGASAFRREGSTSRRRRWLVNKLKNEGWWMMLSNGSRNSKMESGYDDAVPFGKMFIEAAPDRMIWGTDWPHVNWRKKRMMNDAETVELLYRYVDNDQALLKKILVDNPARLHGFAD